MVYMYIKLIHIAPLLLSILLFIFLHHHTHNRSSRILILSKIKEGEREEEGKIDDDDDVGSMEVGLNFKETELCLGLPGGGGESDAVKTSGKRGFSETVDLKLNLHSDESDLKETVENSSVDGGAAPLKDPVKPPAKAQVVGWPPVRSFRKNVMASKQKSGGEESAAVACSGGGAAFVKVSMDGAPYLRKVDLKMYTSYKELSDALAKMFSSFTMSNYGSQGMIDFMNERKLMDLLNSSEYVPSYEDKDGDWMLVGDVPWEMFVDSCKRLRIMKGSEAIGLAPRAMEKCKSRC